jgi:pimeloyl-ACP methyl ester carboxylesterase
MHSTTFSRGYWLRLVRFTAGLVFLAALIMVSALAYLQFQVFVTPVRNPIGKTPAAVGLTYQPVVLQTEDNLQIAAWQIPGEQPTAVILIHGINANREAMLPTAEILAEAGYPLLLIDLRGHGESEGDRVSYGYYESRDVKAGVDYMARQPAIKHIALLGTSLGGSAVIHTAAREPRVGAVIAQSTFSSLENAVDDAFDNRSIFPKWPFAPIFVILAEWYLDVDMEQINSARDLASISPRPVLIIHGRQDEMFPVHHAEDMYRSATEPKTLWVIDGLGHADPALNHRDEYRQLLLSFLAEAFDSPTNRENLH